MMREYNLSLEKSDNEKEFFYIGLAHTVAKHYRIIKIGTTKNLDQRLKQHRAKADYKNPDHALTDFEYVQTFKLAKANTLRLENSIRAQLRSLMATDEIFERNDRFVIMHNDPIRFNITIQTKTYTVDVPGEECFADD